MGRSRLIASALVLLTVPVAPGLIAGKPLPRVRRAQETPLPDTPAERERVRKLFIESLVTEIEQLASDGNRSWAAARTLPIVWAENSERGRRFAELTVLAAASASAKVAAEALEPDFDPESVPELLARETAIFTDYGQSLTFVSEQDPELALALFRQTKDRFVGLGHKDHSDELYELGFRLETTALAAREGNPFEIAKAVERYFDVGLIEDGGKLLKKLHEKAPYNAHAVSEALIRKLNEPTPNDPWRNGDYRRVINAFRAIVEVFPHGLKEGAGATVPPFPLSEDARGQLVRAFADASSAVVIQFKLKSPGKVMPVTDICEDFRSYLPALRGYAPGEINQLQAMLDDLSTTEPEPGTTETAVETNQRMTVAPPFPPRPAAGVAKDPVLTLEERLARIDQLPEHLKVGELVRLAYQYGNARQVDTGRGFLRRIPNRYLRRLAIESFNERFAEIPSRTTRNKKPKMTGPLAITESREKQVERLIQQARSEVKNGRKETAARLLFAAIERSGGRVPRNPLHLKQLNAITSLYLVADPLVGIDLLGNLIAKMNDSYEALAVLDGFVTDKQQNQIQFPENEFPLAEKLPLDIFYEPLPRMLADLSEKRFTQTALLVERVRRPELRLRLRIQILTALQPKK
jgi:hypothetical protein